MRGQTNLRSLVRRGVGPAHQHIKVCAAAIVAFHAPITGRSMGRDSAVIEFLRGTRRLNPPHPRTVPPWDLPTVLKALKGPPFEPLQSTSPRALSLKTALLLALPSVKWEGDLQALSINPACLEFGPNDSKVVLKPRLGYVPRCSRLCSVPRNPCSAPSGPWGYNWAFCLIRKVRTAFFWLR